MSTVDDLYFPLGKILTYNRNFNFINSERGTGKTYTLQKWLVRQFLEKQRQSVYITQFKNELEEIGVKDPFKKVLDNEYPNIEYTQIGHDLYLNGELFCFGIPLTDAQKTKKKSFPKVYYIMFDEYMKENAKRNSFVKNEVDEFLSIYSTIDRYEDRVKCFFLGNTTTQYNIYHMHPAFNLPVIKKGEIWTSENVLYFYYAPPQKFKDKVSSNKFLNMIKGTSYGNYSSEGQFVEDTEEWIEKRTEGAKHTFNFIYLGNTFGVWIDYNKGKIYISDKYDPSCKLMYSLTLDDHRENTMLTKASKSVYLKMLTDNYRLANVRFETMKIKKESIGGIQLLL